MNSERYQFASTIMKNVTRGATIDQKWEQTGPGGSQGVPTNQYKCEKYKRNANANIKRRKNFLFLICGD